MGGESVVHGQTSWNASSGGAWNSAGNWSNGVPTSTSDVYFDSGLSGTISFTDSQLLFKNLVFTGTANDIVFYSENETAPLLRNTAGNFRLGYDSSGQKLKIDGIRLLAVGASGVGIQSTAGTGNESSNDTLSCRGGKQCF